ncbi:hydroxymethylglutaryl-CoA lyase [Polluticaenibacter yanchengensis]|uniref:Hydroxymethylglutaryl-CoA lyase n=1 Tax=Polluticaenibacter yanchengensis TaxID=3014562 RepID=A0ABT4UL02_9BACT|nr:hydroxymethylglutaryl-CoA lyase [Chitinophagaceae bacterium LY-5]
MLRHIEITECPRDAMQGWHRPIDTSEKVNYLKALLKVGFHSLDCGSFVSPKAIPQMADTATVLSEISAETGTNKLLVIVANERGGEQAVLQDKVTYLGFPFSISPTFQQLNTNSTIEESWQRVQRIYKLCRLHNKQLVVYISMAFGNPYGDEYNAEIVYNWVNKMKELGVNTISLADTVGLSTPEQVFDITKKVIDNSPGVNIGVHLHSTPQMALAKIEAAYNAGCNKFDSAIGGIGGCPMAQNDLVGNIDTSTLLYFFQDKQVQLEIDTEAYRNAQAIAASIFY